MARVPRPRSLRSVRRAAAQLLRALDVTPPFDLDELCRRFGDHRGRRVELTPYDFPSPTVFGLWVGTTSTDHVFYERNTTPDHQRHIVLHEIGHMLFEHAGDGPGDEVLPTLPSGLVHGALYRCGSTGSASEQEAELFATVVATWHGTLGALDTATGSPVERAFDEPTGWL